MKPIEKLKEPEGAMEITEEIQKEETAPKLNTVEEQDSIMLDESRNNTMEVEEENVDINEEEKLKETDNTMEEDASKINLDKDDSMMIVEEPKKTEEVRTFFNEKPKKKPSEVSIPATIPDKSLFQINNDFLLLLNTGSEATNDDNNSIGNVSNFFDFFGEPEKRDTTQEDNGGEFNFNFGAGNATQDSQNSFHFQLDGSMAGSAAGDAKERKKKTKSFFDF